MSAVNFSKCINILISEFLTEQMITGSVTLILRNTGIT